MSTLPPDVAAAVDGLTRRCRTAAATKGACAAFIATRDREHAFAVVETVADSGAMPLHHISPSGVRAYDRATLSWRVVRPGDLTPSMMIEDAQGRGGLVLCEEFVRQIEDGNQNVLARVQLAELLARPIIGPNGLVFTMMDAPDAESRLPALLEGQIPRFILGYPRAGELERIVRTEIAEFAHAENSRISVDGIRSAAPALASCLVGLTRKAARDLLRDALAANLADLAEAENFLRVRKAERLGRELAMEVLDAGPAEIPVGVDNLIDNIEMLKPRMRTYGRDRARGILLVGPPGTGKTMLARAVGHITGLPVVVFRISSLMNSLLGETERQFARAFATLEAMAPCVVFIDEIEKAFGDSGERDGGTMMRVSGALLSWLSDNMHPTFIVATCNSLTRMGEIGATMTRSERFDGSFFVDVPDAGARAKILAPLLAEHADSAVLRRLAEATENFSGADLFAIVKTARARAAFRNEVFSAQHVFAEADRKRPRAAALYQQFEQLRQWGARNCEPAA